MEFWRADEHGGRTRTSGRKEGLLCVQARTEVSGRVGSLCAMFKFELRTLLPSLCLCSSTRTVGAMGVSEC
jgi:hypothetical protein